MEPVWKSLIGRFVALRLTAHQLRVCDARLAGWKTSGQKIRRPRKSDSAYLGILHMDRFRLRLHLHPLWEDLICLTYIATAYICHEARLDLPWTFYMFPQNDLSFHPDQRLAHSTARFGRAGIALPVAVSKMDEPIETFGNMDGWNLMKPHETVKHGMIWGFGWVAGPLAENVLRISIWNHLRRRTWRLLVPFLWRTAQLRWEPADPNKDMISSAETVTVTNWNRVTHSTSNLIKRDPFLESSILIAIN